MLHALYSRGSDVLYLESMFAWCVRIQRVFLDGENDGPYTGEEETSDIGADIIWEYDMMEELDVFPAQSGDLFACGCGRSAICHYGPMVFDEGHIAHSFASVAQLIAVDLITGELVWEKAYPGENILHGQWSNPGLWRDRWQAASSLPRGRWLVYSLDPQTRRFDWKFDCNPKDSVWELGGRGTRNAIISTPVIYDNKVFIGVGQDPEHGEGIGHLWAIDATGTGRCDGKPCGVAFWQ